MLGHRKLVNTIELASEAGPVAIQQEKWSLNLQIKVQIHVQMQIKMQIQIDIKMKIHI